MSSNFKLYDPIEDTIVKVNAGGGSSGGGVPSTGGTFTGNVTMQQPAKILQCELPNGPCDLVNKSYTDSTFLPLSGGIMGGQIVQPSGPSSVNDLVNKAYVDSQVAPDATTLVKGKIRLAGDLSGTADAPLVKPNAITNVKLVTLSNVSQLKGSSSTSADATDIALGTGLSMSGTTLNVAATADATTTSKGVVQLAGDLSGTAASPEVAPLAITNAKLADLSGTSQLKGSSDTSASTTDIALGTGLSMSGTTLNVAATADATTTSKGVVQLAGDLSGTAVAPEVAPLAITNAKLATLSNTSQLKGSSSTSADATDITLGAGLSMSGTTLNAAVAADATTTSKGVVQLAGDLSGTAVAPEVGLNKVTYTKIQQIGASSLLGNATNVTANAQEIAIGSLVFSSNTLNSPISFYSGNDPNINTPTDRPATNNTIYMGIDNILWVWKNSYYISLTPKKLLMFGQSKKEQEMFQDNAVKFETANLINPSSQSLQITSETEASRFTFSVLYAPVFVKMTVSIAGLTTTNTVAQFATFQVGSFTSIGPGLILNTTNPPTFSSTHTYSEILSITPSSSIQIEIRLESLPLSTPSIKIGGQTSTLGDETNARWILFEEL